MNIIQSINNLNDAMQRLTNNMNLYSDALSEGLPADQKAMVDTTATEDTLENVDLDNVYLDDHDPDTTKEGIPTNQVVDPTPAQTAQVQTAQAHYVGEELDSKGVPWDSRIHGVAKHKNNDGSWRNKKRVVTQFGTKEQWDAYIAQVENEIRNPEPVNTEAVSNQADPSLAGINQGQQSNFNDPSLAGMNNHQQAVDPSQSNFNDPSLAGINQGLNNVANINQGQMQNSNDYQSQATLQYQQVREKVQEAVVQMGDNAAIQNLMNTKYGVQKLSAMPAEHYQAFIDDVHTVMLADQM